MTTAYAANNLNGPVILVSKDISFTFPFGYAYLAAYLKQQGENVEIIFKPEDQSQFRDFAKKLVARKPLLVGFGTIYPDLYDTDEFIKILNQEGRDFPIVIGGQMVTPTPEFALEITGADYGVIGEGEIILYQLVRALRQGLNPLDVKGLVVKCDDKIIATGPGEYFCDLSQLPDVPYDIIPPEKWLGIGRYYAGMGVPHWHFNDRVIPIHGGRGCPFRCNFCYHHSLPRYRKIDQMMKGIEDLIEKLDANMLYFGDDLVLASPERARELIAYIKKMKRPIEYSVSCRFDILNRIDDDLLKEMKASGCRIMGLGIESGSQRILDVMDKKITVEQIIFGLKRLKNAGILPTVSIMVGQLSETVEDVEMSITLMLQTVRDNKNINYAFTITTPFPGTELYNLAMQRGILKNHLDFYQRFDPCNDIGAVSVNLSAMTDEKVVEMYEKIWKIYTEEKKRLIGRPAASVEFIRKAGNWLNRKIETRVFTKLPDNPAVKAVKNVYYAVYDFCQNFLDGLRLKLLGLK